MTTGTKVSSYATKKIVSVGVTIFLLLAFVLLWEFTSVLHFAEYRVQDAAFQWEGIADSDTIVVLGIDEYAAEKAAWPWPRYLIAEAIKILNRYEDARPAVIAIDIMYTEESRFPGEDEALFRAVYGTDNVLLASAIRVGIDRSINIIQARQLDINLPIPSLLPHVRHGIVNGITDVDGFKRNALLWAEYDGEKHLSFPLAAAMMYKGTDELPQFVLENDYMFIRYTGGPGEAGGMGDFFWYSIVQVFCETFDPSFFDGMIVFIGPYAMGMMDQHLVPINPEVLMFGVEIHANVTQAILDGIFMRRVSNSASVLITAAMLIGAMLIGEITGIKKAVAIWLLAAVAYSAATAYTFYYLYLVPPLFLPLLSIAIVSVYQLVYGYVLQSMEKSKLRSTFKKYVDPKLVDSLITSGEADNDGAGKKKHIAVIFVDVRGFTPMTESLRDTPEIIVETLNAYLELTSTAVFNNGGSVDKFIGDSTMALFNGFVPQDDYVFKAVKAAWDMILGAEAVNKSIMEKYGIDIGFGVGVHCGEAIVGNLGPHFRKDYTAIGDTVNTAARLESNAKKSQVLISRDVYDLLSDRIQAKSIGEIPLKGKSVPLEVFSLVGVNE
ncbi:MAG: adenylate/guanylate cyclase domain-containing protein [Defluviitaleaceae bacterium]|nr:adenylate/guanylate cyclase domain-containing protein [Defluviitaleaceae bacterium]MCL2262991.1 adenylate/guanylate cyclase domain-containing protein [Defluviitaleaceae bacterium]